VLLNAPVISDGTVILDLFQLEDAVSHLAGEDDELERRFGWFPRRSTLVGVRESIARWRQDWAIGGPRRAFALRLVHGGELVGGCELRMREDASAGMSYWTLAAHRRRGLATRGVRLAIGYAFGTLGLTEIELEIEPDNLASRGVARRAGFTEVGTTQASPGANAEPRTMLRYLLRAGPSGFVRLPATAADRDFARRVHHLAYRDVVERQYGAWVEAQQDGFFESSWDSAPHDIIVVDGEPCGYVSIEDHITDVHVRELVLAPDYQGRGIGSAVLRTMIERARARGVPVHLGTHLANRAANLYRRLGFRQIGTTETHFIFEWSPAD